MRLPSVKTISKKFPYLNKDEVKIFRNTLEKYSHNPELCLEKLDQLLENCGVEYISDNEDNCIDCYGILYINSGDSYVETILYDYRKGRFIISSWGDIVENNGKRFMS